MSVATENIPGSSIHYWPLVTRICHSSAWWINKIFFISNSIQRIISFSFNAQRLFQFLFCHSRNILHPKPFSGKRFRID